MVRVAQLVERHEHILRSRVRIPPLTIALLSGHGNTFDRREGQVLRAFPQGLASWLLNLPDQGFYTRDFGSRERVFIFLSFELA